MIVVVDGAVDVGATLVVHDDEIDLIFLKVDDKGGAHVQGAVDDHDHDNAHVHVHDQRRAS